MGQLIKLQDYVSRYEQDIFLYPSRFVRLKTQQWDKWKRAWENGDSLQERVETPAVPEWYEEEKEPFFTRIKDLFKRGKEEEEEEIFAKVPTNTFSFSPSLSTQPNTLDELKRNFLDQLYAFQLKWATTTIAEQSFIDKHFYEDVRLKYFLQRFPDTYLVLYHPIFLLKTAPVEVEIILITPTEVWCITFLEEEDRAVFVGSNEHFWLKRNQEQEQKVLNPLIALNRTEKVTKNILNHYEIELPIQKAVLTRNGYIDYPSAPYDTKFIERRNYEKWFQNMRSQRSPLKHIQLKAAQALLNYCQTTSVRRPEWDVEPEQEY
ncbi:nuclease-related domain-containing protein [Robertmurraya massiliosenegalensis]|uniref:nuclease-related domain-containing protein n=1 Tax=Robertmurraya massiliosenegalensis TaxID=1287657 RepID=UPI0002FEC866|nr:nuclease-related domain-containing protein [Robertmurraya massiliosenegalensis]